MGLARDIKAAGGTPIIVTPLSRTRYKNGQFADSFVSWRAAAIAAAKAGSYAYIDLNAESSRYVKAIGQAASTKYSSDTTHLTAEGGKVFARIVADLLVERFPDFKPYLRADPAMSAAIKNGKPV
jgi:lysophospholipase L1-like esterase